MKYTIKYARLFMDCNCWRFIYVFSNGCEPNDAANAFSTLFVKSINMKGAVIALFEFAGALLMGSHVTETIRKT